MSRGEDVRLPVFVVPSSLVFYADDQKTHKQVLTLYNPHDFPIKFQVLCTKSRKYGVVCPKGRLHPRHCVDIVVRHNAISPASYGVTDRFRIHVREHGSSSVSGWKEVEAKLLPGRPAPSASSPSEEFEQLPEQGNVVSREYRMPALPGGTSRGGPSVVVLTIAALCLAVLMLPDEGDQHPQIPSYLHLTTNKKVVAAFILGLVTMSILY